ncbi:MAG TPA: hypothetical protein VK212_03145 [Lentimicrobium sp.]|nr:hypothetical protein [Lentimicrobium sp.]
MKYLLISSFTTLASIPAYAYSGNAVTSIVATIVSAIIFTGVVVLIKTLRSDHKHKGN